MTPAEFSTRMSAICGLKDIGLVKEAGLHLIVTELGYGFPAFLPALEQFATRISDATAAAERNARAERRRAQNVRAAL